MGLTASPITQENFDKNRLMQEIKELCENLNSKFTRYSNEKNKN